MYIDPSKLTSKGKKVLKSIMAGPYPYDYSPFLSVGSYALFNSYDDHCKFRGEWEELKVLRELFSGTTIEEGDDPTDPWIDGLDGLTPQEHIIYSNLVKIILRLRQKVEYLEGEVDRIDRRLPHEGDWGDC